VHGNYGLNFATYWVNRLKNSVVTFFIGISL